MPGHLGFQGSLDLGLGRPWDSAATVQYNKGRDSVPDATTLCKKLWCGQGSQCGFPKSENETWLVSTGLGGGLRKLE